MTAPGNSAVLFVLLAAFLACTGYAAGRLHQWYRTGQDRDEAYRDGYDTATRSVFSMAARIIGPRALSARPSGPRLRCGRPPRPGMQVRARRTSSAILELWLPFCDFASDSCQPQLQDRGRAPAGFRG
jgi:hypothetical protein